METYEKLELLKPTIYQLYSKEGRSKVYISKLLEVNRKKLTEKINEWKFPKAEPRRHLTPSSRKFLNKHRKTIIARLKHDSTITDIAKELGIRRSVLLKTYIKNDEELLNAYNNYKNRKKAKHQKNIHDLMEKSYHVYDIVDYDGEEWTSIKGFSGYMISNYGRVKKYAKKYDNYFLLSPQPNKNNGRLYISMTNEKGKVKNLQIARLVGFAFVKGYSEENNTINHHDGNVQNNFYLNLFWDSQSGNNKHAYEVLHRPVNKGKRYQFKKILYKDKYEFKTIRSFAKFIGKSETQTRRYIDNPEKYDIKLIM